MAKKLTARDEYAMRFNIAMDGNETWFVFDMDTDERVAEGYEHRSSALADCQFRNRENARA